MQKTAVIIGASKETKHAIYIAKKHGFFVVAVDGDAATPSLSLADISIVIDLKQKELVAKELEKYNPSIVVPTPIGRFLTTTGYINDYFDLKGVSEKQATICTDKHLFHNTIKRDAEHFIYNINLKPRFPVVVKPRHGSGSKGVHIVHRQSEFDKLDVDDAYIVETLVAGTEYGMDAIVVNGVFEPVLLRKKDIENGDCNSYTSVQFLDSIKEKMTQVCKDIGFENAILHADIIDTGGEPFVIEMSARPSGHNLHDVFTTFVTGVDMIEEFITGVKSERKKIESYTFNWKEGKIYETNTGVIVR